MSIKIHYIQCILKKEKNLQTSWLPEKYAHIGKNLKLLENDEWQDGWQVISRGVRISKDSLEILAQSYKRTRQE